MKYVSLYSNTYSSDVTLTLPLNECYQTSRLHYGIVECTSNQVRLKYYSDDSCVDYTGMSDTYNIGDELVLRFRVTEIMCNHGPFNLVRAVNEPTGLEFNRLSLFLSIAAATFCITTLLLLFWLCFHYHRRSNKVADREHRNTEQMI